MENEEKVEVKPSKVLSVLSIIFMSIALVAFLFSLVAYIPSFEAIHGGEGDEAIAGIILLPLFVIIDAVNLVFAIVGMALSIKQGSDTPNAFTITKMVISIIQTSAPILMFILLFI